MKKTTLYLEPNVDRALGRLAARRGVSKAEVIRGVAGLIAEAPGTRRAAAVGEFAAEETAVR